MKQKVIDELVFFQVNETKYAVDIDFVNEINRRFEITHVYGAKDYIQGVINLRGEIVTVVDLKKKLKIECQSKKKMIIALKFNEESVALLVDDVIDIIEVEMSDIGPSPANVSEISRRYFKMVYKTKNELIPILDTDEILKK